MPEATAVAAPGKRKAGGRRQYRQITFAELDRDSTLVAAGLRAMGVKPGTRLALLVRPGIDFISLVFALFKAGAVSILIDPGMGRKNLLRCLAEAEPEGFIAIAQVQAIRWLLGRRFPRREFNVTVGRRLFLGRHDARRTEATGRARSRTCAEPPSRPTIRPRSFSPPAAPDRPRACSIATATSTPRSTRLRDFYDIRPGEIDLPGFPLFGLFNCAMGVTTVIPDMDPTRPARSIRGRSSRRCATGT